jgi:hypothetical protein
MKLCRLRYVLLVATIVALAACATQTTDDTSQAGSSRAAASTTVVEDSVGPTSVTESVASTVGSAAPGLRQLGLPGMSLDEPAGEYGWTSGSGERGGMHRVVVDGSESRQTQLVFGVSANCFHAGGNPVPVTVAGLDGLYVEPYEGSSVTFSGRGGGTTGAYALPIGDRTLCVYLTWDPATTPEELRAAREVVESIRGEPHGEDGIRINFYLEAGWDTG